MKIEGERNGTTVQVNGIYIEVAIFVVLPLCPRILQNNNIKLQYRKYPKRYPKKENFSTVFLLSHLKKKEKKKKRPSVSLFFS